MNDDSPPLDGDPSFEALYTHHSRSYFNRLFLISLKKGYVFCPISKVANSSIKSFLFEAELRSAGVYSAARRMDTARIHDFLWSPLVYPYQLPGPMLRHHLFSPDIVRFLFVRNPADRLVSCFLDRVQTENSAPNRIVRKALGVSHTRDISFEDFVAFIAEQPIADMNPHWRPIYHEACCDTLQYRHVFRFETLLDDMKTILETFYPVVSRKIDLSQNFSPRQTKANERIRSVASPSSMRRIATIYAKDYEHFGYTA